MATVRTVPSTGWATASRADAAALARAMRSDPVPAPSASTPAMPRSSWARIVPEFPRAPISAPCAMARTASAVEGTEVPVSWAAKTASTAAAADSTVR